MWISYYTNTNYLTFKLLCDTNDKKNDTVLSLGASYFGSVAKALYFDFNENLENEKTLFLFFFVTVYVKNEHCI